MGLSSAAIHALAIICLVRCCKRGQLSSATGNCVSTSHIDSCPAKVVDLLSPTCVPNSSARMSDQHEQATSDSDSRYL
ncbi:hypothetical protein M405DRAFT_810881 [Rhizopogon salebrosus TDB-379]|nr:hypothetical protein M405DRAFT_810881 [Rhizopogon salebrosus TDB-379]